MNFTREPIIETIVTPRDGCRLVVRSSKGSGHEEYSVEALEVVSFGQSLFFRSLERPKCFLVPVSDYEVVEVKETRMVLKAGPLEKGVKIGGGREANVKSPKEKSDEDTLVMETYEEEDVEPTDSETKETAAQDPRIDKKRDRRRHRRRKGKADDKEEGDQEVREKSAPIDDMSESYAEDVVKPQRVLVDSPHVFSTLIPPPPTLISETLASYKGNAEYRKAFFEPSVPESEEELEVKEHEKEREIPPPPPLPDEF